MTDFERNNERIDAELFEDVEKKYNFFDIYEIETAEVYGNFVWVQSRDGSSSMRFPLCDSLCNYHEDMESQEPAYYSDSNGSIKIRSVDRVDLSETDVKFLKTARSQFKKQVEQASYLVSVDLAGFERKTVEVLNERDKSIEERKSRAKHGKGGFTKNWNGKVADQVLFHPKPKPNKDVIKRANREIEIAKKQIELHNTRKELMRVRGAPKVDTQGDDEEEFAKLIGDHDFHYSTISSCSDRDEALNEAAWAEYTGGQIPEYSEFHFKTPKKVNLTTDHRDHCYRMSELFDKGIHLVDVSTVFLSRRDADHRLFVVRYLCFLRDALYYWLHVFKFWYLRLFYNYDRREAFDKTLSADFKHHFEFASCDDGCTVVIDLYNELLSRKITGVKCSPDVVLNRMMTRLKNIGTMNLPTELNETGIYQNTLRLAFVRYCRNEDWDYRDFGHADKYLESSETPMCSMGTLKEILDYPLSAESKVVFESRKDVFVIPRATPPLLYRWVLWFLALFSQARAEPISELLKEGYVNVWVLILVHTMLHFWLALESSQQNTVKDIFDRLRSMTYRRSTNGWSIAITWLLVRMSYGWLRPTEALMSTAIIMAVSTYRSSLKSIASSRPSSILTSNTPVLSIPGPIMRSVSLVLLLVPLSGLFLLQTVILSNIFQSEIELHTLNPLPEMVVWCLRLTILLLSVILHRILCKIASLSYISIYFKIAQIISALISALTKGLMRLFDVLCQLIKCHCWAMCILSMVSVCLEKCSPVSVTDLQISCSCYISLAYVGLLVWTGCVKEMTVFSLSPNGFVETSLTSVRLVALLLKSSASSTNLSVTPVSVVWYTMYAQSIYFVNRSRLWPDLVGNYVLPPCDLVSAWVSFVQKLPAWVTSVPVVLYSGLSRLVHWSSPVTINQTLVTLHGMDISPKVLMYFFILLPLISVGLVLMIAYFLNVVITYLSMSNMTLNEKSSMLPRWRNYLVDRDYNYCLELGLLTPGRKTGNDMWLDTTQEHPESLSRISRNSSMTVRREIR